MVVIIGVFDNNVPVKMHGALYHDVPKSDKEKLNSGKENISLIISSLSQCIKYRTDQLQDVKKLEKLNNAFLRHMIAKVPT